MYALMMFLKAIYIIKTTQKTISQERRNYNGGMTLALPRVHICNVELESHTTNPTKNSNRSHLGHTY